MNRAIIVFGRLPRPGAVKTRLIPKLGEMGAADLYRAMLLDVLERTLEASDLCRARPIFAVDTGDEDLEAVRPLASGFSVVAQDRGELGQRLLVACQGAAADEIILIGSDAPGLSAVRMKEAFDALVELDAVIIPAIDGGYVLLGTRGVQPQLFDGIPWSTPRVAVATVEAAKRAGLGIGRLEPEVRDLDVPDDLTALLETLDPRSRTAVAIRRALDRA